MAHDESKPGLVICKRKFLGVCQETTETCCRAGSHEPFGTCTAKPVECNGKAIC